MEKVFILVAFSAFIAILILSLTYGLNKSEKLECLKWQKQATEIVGFYLTEAEAEQCRHHNIEINFTI